MKMPKYLKLQNAIFRKHFTKKPASLLALLSNPFILWLLSVTFITIGGAYITKRQECLSNARLDGSAYRQLAEEVHERRMRIIRAAFSSSNTIDFLKQARDTRFATFKQFDGQSLSSLITQIGDLNHKIDGIRVAYEEAQNKRDTFAMDIGNIEDELDGRNRYVRDQDLSRFRSFGEDMMIVYITLKLGLAARDFVPNCSPSTLLHDMFSDVESRHIRFVRNNDIRAVR